MSLGVRGMKDSLAKQITPFSPIVELKVAGIFGKAYVNKFWLMIGIFRNTYNVYNIKTTLNDRFYMT